MTTKTSGQTIYNMPSSVSFIEALVTGIYSGKIFDIDDKDPFWLTKAVIFLPTRRACETMEQTLIRFNKKSGLLLPQIIPIGDIDDEDQNLRDLEIIKQVALPPSISNIRRQLLLAQLIRTWSITNQKAKGQLNRSWTMENIMRLANELAKLIDSTEIEGLEFSSLINLAPDEYAHHWREIVKFLDIVTKAWPKILSEEGFIDSVKRRNLALQYFTKLWEEKPPTYPIIMAGSTGTVPAVAKLMNTISFLPNGVVVLPGLDNNLNSNSWKNVGPTHPQFALKTLIEKLCIKRDKIEFWPGSLDFKQNKARSKVLSTALLPSSSEIVLNNKNPLNNEATTNLTLIECDDIYEESGIIALKMRLALEGFPKYKDIVTTKVSNNYKTIALITADRRLAQRVAIELKKWKIIVNDSAGIAINQTTEGSLFQLTSRLFKKELSPVDLLAVLKHPLSSGGISSEKFKDYSQEFEFKFLRGLRPAAGLLGLEDIEQNLFLDNDIDSWINSLFNMLRKSHGCFTSDNGQFLNVLYMHIKVTEWIASTNNSTGANRLFSGTNGHELFLFLEELIENSKPVGKVSISDYIAIIDSLMEKIVIREKKETHPNIFIWSPLEARLQRADVTILAGLNEGIWPPKPSNDPWMNRPIREAFGLPPAEKRIGLSAHDFVQAASSEEVMITRARRNQEGLTVPSRWFLRLKNILETESQIPMPYSKGEYWKNLYKNTQKIKGIICPAKPPAPRPSLKSRPRKLSVTQIERWIKDPYSIYARHILNLHPIEPLEPVINSVDKGSIIHEILDEFSKNTIHKFPEDAYQHLIMIGKKAWKSKNVESATLGLWWPRFERIAEWFIKNELDRRSRVNPIGTELVGFIELKRPGGNFRLTAKADRIDKLSDGGLNILDYKTGKIPSKKDIEEGKAPQLALEAAIAESGGFENISATTVEEMEYWHLTGGDPAGEIKKINLNIPEQIAQELHRLEILIDLFDKEETPYLVEPRPSWGPTWNDYTHLARVKEWAFKISDEENK